MSIDEIIDLPIKKISDDNCILFLWITYPQLNHAINLIEAWGFKYKTIAFQWIKLNKKVNKEEIKIQSIKDMEKSCVFGIGNWTRSNSECVLLATKGKITRINNSISQLIFEPIKRHSEKPSVVRDKIIDLVGNLPRIELFARQEVNGWDCWGNEL